MIIHIHLLYSYFSNSVSPLLGCSDTECAAISCFIISMTWHSSHFPVLCFLVMCSVKCSSVYLYHVFITEHCHKAVSWSGFKSESLMSRRDMTFLRKRNPSEDMKKKLLRTLPHLGLTTWWNYESLQQVFKCFILLMVIELFNA